MSYSTSTVNSTFEPPMQRLDQWRITGGELERAWSVTHRRGAPNLSWSHRFLLLSSLFSGRPSAWVLALDARLCALEAVFGASPGAPDSQAFQTAASAELRPRGEDFLFREDTRW